MSLRLEFQRLAGERLPKADLEALFADYAEAHFVRPDIFPEQGEEADHVRRILASPVNPWALEPWLRRRDPQHLLSRKLALITHLTQGPAASAPPPGLIRLAALTARDLLASLFAGLQGARHGLL